MRRAILASVKQAISGKGFCLGVLGVVFIIFASSVQDIVTAFREKELLSYGFHNTLLINALTSDAMTLVLLHLQYTLPAHRIPFLLGIWHQMFLKHKMKYL